MFPGLSHTLALALAAAAAIAGCSINAVEGGAVPDRATVFNTYSGDAGSDAHQSALLDGAGGSADVSVISPTVGSPLCSIAPGAACNPDQPTTAQLCDQAPDGGKYNAGGGYSDASLACRVQIMAPAQNGEPATVVTACSVAGSHVDGQSCKVSSDCSAGFECTGAAGSVGSGTCRHYCCAGNSQCAADQFCDIQPLTEAATNRVPVCMPIEPAMGCDMLSATSCPTGETCAVVREDGSTGCVEVGEKQAGDSCSSDHCAAGLVCLGTSAARTCYTICSTTGPSHCSPLTCQGGLPLFQDPKVGVCR